MNSLKRSLHGIFPKRRATAKPSAAEIEAQLKRAANKFKKSCERQRFRNDRATYDLTVGRLAAAKKFSMIENILEHQKKYSDIRCEGFAARLISLYGRSGMFEHARKLFDEMPSLDCPRGTASFNALLKAGLDSENPGAVVEAFRDLPRMVSVEPDLISHNILVHALCKAGDLDGALSALRELGCSGLKPDLFTFNTVLDSLYKSGRFSEGETVFAAMERDGVAPDVRTYNARLRGIFRCGGGGSGGLTGDEVVAEMERRRIRPDTFSYNALIKGHLCKFTPDLNEAAKWYRELRKSEFAPDVLTFEMLIPACCDGGDFNMAFELCLEAIDCRLRLSARVFGQVVDGLVWEDKTDEALKLANLVNSSKYLGYRLRSPVV